jgi:hypothetical protein
MHTLGAELVQLHEDLWVVNRPQRFFGLELGTRMTVVRFGRDRTLVSARPAARVDLTRILAGDFDAIVLAHGEVIAGGGRDALARAYRWLGTP